MKTQNCVTNKPIRCTTHFHACDCREYEFEKVRKELQEKDRIILSQEKERQKTEAFWKEKLEKLQTENASYIKQIQDKNLSLVELIEPMSRKIAEKDAEIESLEKKFKNEEDCWLISMESRDEKITDLQKENEEMRKDLLYFWTWIVGGYESRPETGLRNELDKMEEKYPWLRCETREPPESNLSETPNSSKEGV